MIDNQQNNKRIAKNTVFLAIRQVIVMAIALYVSRITLRALGVDDFGIYNVICGFVSMFTFLNGAFTTGIQRFYNFEFGKNGTEGANRVFVNAVLVQISLAIIIVILLESIGLWYMYEKMVVPDNRFNAAMWVFQISVVSTVVMMLQVPYNAAILAHEKMDFLSFLSILNQVLKLIIVVVLQYLSGDKLILYGLLFLGITIIDLILNLIYAHAKFKEVNYQTKIDKPLLKQMFSFSGWNIFGKFSYVMREQGLNMVLNLFFGPAVNAARGLAFQVTGALNGFVSNVNVAVKPHLTQSFAQGNIDRTLSLFHTVSKLCFFILFFLSLPICLEIDFVLNLWLGKGEVPDYTNIFIILVSLMLLLRTLSTQISFVVHATGVMVKYQVVTSIIDLMIVPFAYIALKLNAFPPIVFLVAMAVSIVDFVVSLFILRGIINISLKHYAQHVIIPLILFSSASILIPLSARLRMTAGWFRFFLVLSLSCISVIVCFYTLGLNLRERVIAKTYTIQYIKKLKHNG